MFFTCFSVNDKCYSSSNSPLKIKNQNFEALQSLSIIKNNEDGIILKFCHNFVDVEEIQGKRINIFYYSPTYGVFNQKKLFVYKIIKTTAYILLECLSLQNLLHINKAEQFSLNCRANFGDLHCKIDLKSYSISGIVKEYDCLKNEVLGDALNLNDETRFSYGRIKIDHSVFVVLNVNCGVIKIVNELNAKIKAGSSYTLVQGCDKSFETCKTQYKNTKNFKGEPFLFSKNSDFIFYPM